MMSLKCFGTGAAAIGLCALAALPADAKQTAVQGRPALLTKLVECRAIAEPGARLACYDATARALDSAERQGDVVVVDRAQAEAARRGLFGFELPSMPDLFGRGAAGEPLNAVQTTLTRAVMGGDGQWIFTLDDGSVWRQTDGRSIGFRNRAGQPVRVRRAAMSSFLLSVDGSTGVRVRRQ